MARSSVRRAHDSCQRHLNSRPGAARSHCPAGGRRGTAHRTRLHASGLRHPRLLEPGAPRHQGLGRLVKDSSWKTRKRKDGTTEWIPPPHLDRGHHLLKTFSTGSGGWADTQCPTAPTTTTVYPWCRCNRCSRGGRSSTRVPQRPRLPHQPRLGWARLAPLTFSRRCSPRARDSPVPM